MVAPLVVACPRCGSAVEWTPEARWRPFCSERCKLIDLGAWASGTYRIPVAQAPDPGEIDVAHDAGMDASGTDEPRRD